MSDRPGPLAAAPKEERPADEIRVVDILTGDNPRSLINIVPEAMKRAILEVPQEFLEKNETQLRRSVRPSSTDNRLRISFWQEYDRAQMEMRPMKLSSIYGGVCSIQYFNGVYLKQMPRVAWMILPPMAYMKAAEEALCHGIERMREMLDMPLMDKKRKIPNVKMCEAVIKIVTFLDLRVKGAHVQKSLNVTAHTGKVTKIMEYSNMGDIDKKIKQLEEEVAAKLRGPGAERHRTFEEIEAVVSMEGAVREREPEDSEVTEDDEASDPGA